MFDKQPVDLPSDSTVHLAIQGLHNTLYLLRRQQLQFHNILSSHFVQFAPDCLILYIVLYHRSHDF